MRPGFLLALLGSLAVLVGVVVYNARSGAPQAAPPSPHPPVAVTDLGIDNVIIVVGDGMGPAQIEAGRAFAVGSDGALTFEDWPFSASITHQNALGAVTDSAASATAMATGVTVANGVISVDESGTAMGTALELAAASGKATGLVTTSYLTDATPAAFGAHANRRGDDDIIAASYFDHTRPDVLMGSRTPAASAAAAAAAGYEVVTDRAGLAGLDLRTAPVAGIFDPFRPPGHPDRSTDSPTLAAMTQAALDVLDDDPDGLFLLVEHEGPDSYSHDNDVVNLVRSVAELDDAVAVIEAWLVDNPDTLVIVLADHETGGLVVESVGDAGDVPTVSWATTGHTATPITAYATGIGAERLHTEDVQTNADIYGLIASGYEPPPHECALTGDSLEWTHDERPRTSTRRCFRLGD